MKREVLLNEMKKFTSFADWARAKNVSRQAIDIMLKRHNLKKEWNEHLKNIKCFSKFGNQKKRSGIAKIIFPEINSIYFVASEKDIRMTGIKFINKIRNGKCHAYLQPHLNTFKVKMIFMDEFVFEEQKILIEQCNASKQYKCLNKNLPKGTRTFQDRYKKDNKISYEKYRLLDKKKSPYPGMTWVWRTQRWKLQPVINGKQVHIGYEKDEKRAIQRIIDYKNTHERKV